MYVRVLDHPDLVGAVLVNLVLVIAVVVVLGDLVQRAVAAPALEAVWINPPVVVHSVLAKIGHLQVRNPALLVQRSNHLSAHLQRRIRAPTGSVRCMLRCLHRRHRLLAFGSARGVGVVAFRHRPSRLRRHKARPEMTRAGRAQL